MTDTEKDLHRAATTILRHFSEDACDQAEEAAVNAHIICDAGNANDVVEAFLEALVMKEHQD